MPVELQFFLVFLNMQFRVSLPYSYQPCPKFKFQKSKFIGEFKGKWLWMKWSFLLCKLFSLITNYRWRNQLVSDIINSENLLFPPQQLKCPPTSHCGASTRTKSVCIGSIRRFCPCLRAFRIRRQMGSASTGWKWVSKQCSSDTISGAFRLRSTSKMIHRLPSRSSFTCFACWPILVTTGMLLISLTAILVWQKQC